MKKILLLILIAFTQCANAQDFITVWDLSYSGSSPTSISFGVVTTGTVNYTWETIPSGTNGSGTFSGVTANISGLPTSAKIRLKINPTNFKRILISDGVNKSRLIDVEQWGTVSWISMSGAFYGCNHLNITSTDTPNLSLVNNMISMFTNCSMLNGPSNIGNWNTSSVTDMTGIFAEATSFNQPIGNWNTSNVTSLAVMFFKATSFNQPIGNWNTSNVVHLSTMFAVATSFNQDIGNWNTSNVVEMYQMFTNATSFNQPIENWNMNNVMELTAMFYGATSFNQPIGNWNTANVIYMNNMFVGATSFNQPIGNWNTSNVINMENMFVGATSFNQPIGNWTLNTNVNLNHMLDNCGMDCSNYSTTLNAWVNNPSCPNGRNLGSLNRHYGSNVAMDRANLITNKGWTITGDTMNNAFCCVTDVTNINLSACNSYNFIGQILTQSGIYADTLVSSQGCDSVIKLHLTINHSTTHSIFQTACNSYFFNNQFLTSSGVYYDTLINSVGCDSILSLQLTINNSSFSNVFQSHCNSYFFNNQTLTQSGIYYDTLINSVGCDSMIQLNLSITNNSTTSHLYISDCNQFEFNNQTLNTSGTYFDTLTNVSGCDSFIVLHLTMNNFNTSVSQAGYSVWSNSPQAQFQWINCKDSSIIPGATSQGYTSTSGGSFAVILIVDGCIDTSDCVTIIGLSVENSLKDANILISPNPSQGIYTITSIEGLENASIKVLNLTGQLILQKENLTGKSINIDISKQANGIYFIEINTNKRINSVKVLKK